MISQKILHLATGRLLLFSSAERFATVFIVSMYIYIYTHIIHMVLIACNVCILRWTYYTFSKFLYVHMFIECAR